MKRLIVLVVVLITVLATAQPQERPTVTPRENTVFVGSDGKYEAAPDTAILQFTVAAQEATSEAAYSKASNAAERMRQALKSNGIDPKSAELGFYSLQPVFDWKSSRRKIIAYRVNTNVTLKLRDFTKVGPLTQALSAIEETDNQSVNYTLEDFEAAKQKAVEDAFQKAKASALTVAKASGRTLGDLTYASVDTDDQVRVVSAPMAMKAQTMEMANQAQPPTAEFTPQKITINAHVNAMFDLR
jgi:uncharacterized protein